jgi:DNA replication protein DnaC
VVSRSNNWLLQTENLLLFGPSGVGKTYLAIAFVRRSQASPSSPQKA